MLHPFTICHNARQLSLVLMQIKCALRPSHDTNKSLLNKGFPYEIFFQIPIFSYFMYLWKLVGLIINSFFSQCKVEPIFLRVK